MIKLSSFLSVLCWSAATVIFSWANAETITGRVVGVADGDTITVLDLNSKEHKVRLKGIDAPEKAQPFGVRSKLSLSEQIYGKTVEVRVNKRDRYGRHVGKVIFEDIDINLEQVRRGFAWHYKAYADEQSSLDQELYSAAEKAAREDQRGLWRDSAPTEPWVWRRK